MTQAIRRVLFISPEFPTPEASDGGLANYLRKVCLLLLDRNIQPVVLHVGAQDGVSVQEGTEVRGVSVLRERSWRQQGWRRGALRYYYHWRNCGKVAAAVARALHERPVDVIQVASYRALGIRLAKDLGVPVVVRVSSYTPLCRAADGLRKVPLNWVDDYFESRQLQQATALFAPSAFLANWLWRLESLRAEVIRTPFWLPPVKEDPAALMSLPADKPYLLAIGRLCGIKGTDLLLQALPKVFRSQPDVHMVFAGREEPLPGGMRPAEFIASAPGVEGDRIHLLGSLSTAQLRPIIKSASAVVMSSRVDNYPNACLEAQALGRIVVAVGDTSLEECVEDGVTGFLAKHESVPSLADALVKVMILSASDRQVMEQNVLGLAADRDPQADLDRLIDFYERARQTFASRRTHGLG